MRTLNAFEPTAADHRAFYARLGMAYNTLNRWEWDELLGEKPEGFDQLPNTTKINLLGRRKRCKYDYIAPALRTIREICPMVDYWAGKFDPERATESEIQWFHRHAVLRMASLLAKAGVKI